MKPYRFRDTYGTEFSGPTYIAVVVQMRRAAWLAPGKGPYMREVAARVAALWPGTVVNVTSAVTFIRSLIAAGLLEPKGERIAA
jgi:hypothetical protein